MDLLRKIARTIVPDAIRSKLRGAAFQGYVDERSPTHVAGWVRNLGNPAQRVPFEVLGGDKVIASGTADQPSAILSQLGIGDGQHAFYTTFEPQTDAAIVSVRVKGTTTALPLAPALRTRMDPDSPVARAVLHGQHLQGYVDERSTCHIAGWVRDLHNPTTRLMVDIVITGLGPETLMVTVQANRRSTILDQLKVGDATYAFYAAFDPAITPDQRDHLIARPKGTTRALELAPALATNFNKSSPVLRAIGI